MEKVISKGEGCCASGKPKTVGPKRLAKREERDLNPDHSSQLARLNRLIGQLEGVKRMIVARRYCPEILTQTRAIASALKAVEKGILERHIKHCVSEAMSSRNSKEVDGKIEELISVFERF